jgi:hypothetical protein
MRPPRFRPVGAGPWTEEISPLLMDARRMGFLTLAFPIAPRASQPHHIADWELALDEMFRVSSTYVLLEEPVDDPRSEEKRCGGAGAVP